MIIHYTYFQEKTDIMFIFRKHHQLFEKQDKRNLKAWLRDVLSQIYFKMFSWTTTIETRITKSGVTESAEETLKHGKHIPMFIINLVYKPLLQTTPQNPLTTSNT
jgi:hypothetical protein